jgi:hypothetical protein
MAGRPTTYSEEVASELIDRVEAGEALTTMCKNTHHFPSVRTLYNWKANYPDFAARLEKAQDHGYDAIADQCIEIADTPLEGRKEKRVRGDDGIERVAELEVGDNVQRSKLMVATRIRILELRCQRYRASEAKDKQQRGEKLADKLARIRKKVGM